MLIDVIAPGHIDLDKPVTVVDGVRVTRRQVVLLPHQHAAAENGVYEVVRTGWWRPKLWLARVSPQPEGPFRALHGVVFGNREFRQTTLNEFRLYAWTGPTCQMCQGSGVARYAPPGGYVYARCAACNGHGQEPS